MPVNTEVFKKFLFNVYMLQLYLTYPTSSSCLLHLSNTVGQTAVQLFVKFS